MSRKSLAEHRIAEADAAAERLLGYARMAVSVALIAAILFAANSEFRPDNPFIDRQIAVGVGAMSAYFFIGLSAVLLVRAGRFRPWMAWAYAAADVSIIAGNVMLGVVFSGGSSLLALSFPAAFGIPITLAFGALRLRFDVQIVSTLAVAALVILILFSAPGDETDVETALASVAATYAFPPNLIRVVMLLSTGFLIAIAVARARRLLERIVAETEAKANLTRFLPAEIAQDMRDEALAGLRAGRRAEVGVLFIDIRGFTSLSEEKTPEAVGALLTAYRGAILDIAATHGGVVDKFIGDGALVIFGVDEPDAAAANAMAAAAALVRRFAAEPYRVGVGVHYGEAVIGAIGDDRRLEFTAIGPAVNLASRVEQMTKETGDVALATAEAVSAANGAPAWRDIGLRAVRGLDAPVALWALADRTPN